MLQQTACAGRSAVLFAWVTTASFLPDNNSVQQQQMYRDLAGCNLCLPSIMTGTLVTLHLLMSQAELLGLNTGPQERAAASTV